MNFRLFILWVVLFVLLALIQEEFMRDFGTLVNLTGAAFYASILVYGVKRVSRLKHGIDVIEERSSDDGVMTAVIEKWPTTEKKLLSYRCRVKSNYPDKVYFKEGEFDTLKEAQAWLETTYAQELAKHEERTSRLRR